jgi:hypothetical protein
MDIRSFFKLKNGNKDSNQSQKHGFQYENIIRHKVFKMPAESNNTETHDIPADMNILDKNENCSIKTTGSQTIFCSDISRFYGYSFNEDVKNTIIVIKYNQSETEKIIETIYEIDYNKECHNVLFGNLPKPVIDGYVKQVKSIPRKVGGQEAKAIFDYIVEKKSLKKNYNFEIQINPKVDSNQSRVQCSIPNFETLLKNFIIYKSDPSKPNLLRECLIDDRIQSSKRQRNKKVIK